MPLAAELQAVFIAHRAAVIGEREARRPVCQLRFELFASSQDGTGPAVLGDNVRR
jgi:hypothetical protein